MLDSIASRAIQSLGVDVANLTSRLALNTSIIDEIITQATEIPPDVWSNQSELVNETGHPTGYAVTIEGQTAEKVQALLAFIQSLQ